MWTPLPFAFMLNHFLGIQRRKGIALETREKGIIFSMGNYRFRLSDMIPNAWFYKLKDMGTRRRNHKKEPSSATQPQQILLHSHSHPRKSHHFTRQLAADESPAEPPRKSSKAKPRRRPAAAASRASVRTSSSGCSCGGGAAVESVEADGRPERASQFPSDADVDPANIGIIIENQHKTSPKRSNGWDNGDDAVAQIDQLPPIITRSSSSTDGSTCPTKKEKCLAREPRSSPSRRFPVNSPGPKFRMIMNSPRVSSKRFGQPAAVSRRKSVSKRSLTDSLAIVKSTSDPQRDFRESMVEMIVENKICASSELEDLLACYLSLNTDEYHDIIIKVFKQIWFDMSDFGVH